MIYDDIVRHYGSADKAAQAIGLKGGRHTLYAWRAKGEVPIKYQIEFELDSGGALKADLPAEIRTSVA